MPAHHIETRGIQFRHDEETPFQPFGVLDFVVRNKANRLTTIFAGQIGYDRGALSDRERSVLKQWNLLPRIQRCVFGRFGLSGSRRDGYALVVEAEFS